MPIYHTLGSIPRKRHTVFRKPDGGLYNEELMGHEGFIGTSSLLYHTHPPTTVNTVEHMNTADSTIITSIDSITLDAADPEAAAAFYRDAFGLDARVRTRASDAAGVGFCHGKGQGIIGWGRILGACQPLAGGFDAGKIHGIAGRAHLEIHGIHLGGLHGIQVGN